MIIKSKAGNGNKIHIYIDDEYALTVYDDYWFQNGFKDGETITEEELASLKEEAGFRLAYEKGLDYLTRRSYAKKELFCCFFVNHNYSINLSQGMINRIDIFFMLAPKYAITCGNILKITTFPQLISTFLFYP